MEESNKGDSEELTGEGMLPENPTSTAVGKQATPRKLIHKKVGWSPSRSGILAAERFSPSRISVTKPTMSFSDIISSHKSRLTQVKGNDIDVRSQETQIKSSEEKLRKKLDRLVNVEKIQNPFQFSFVAVFWQQVAATIRRLHGSINTSFSLVPYRSVSYRRHITYSNTSSSSVPYKPNTSSEEVWMLTDILASLSQLIEAIEGQKISRHQFHEIKKLILNSRMDDGKKESVEMCHSKLALILKSHHVDKKPVKLSQDRSLISSQTVEPPKLLELPSISELPMYLLPLFAYCALFPKGHRLVKEMLVNLWMAEGFLLSFNNDEDKEDSEEIANRCFNELLSRGVFHKCVEIGGRVYSCEIHPLAHDVACHIAGEEVEIINSNIQSDIHSVKNEASYIVFILDGLREDNIEHMMAQYNCVRTCLFFGNSDAQSPINMEFKSKNFKHLLRVLGLYGTLVKGVSSYSLQSLRYLGLSGNHNIKEYEGYGDLETLYADGCSQLQCYMPTSLVQNLYLTTKQKGLLCRPKLRILELSHCKELNFVRLDSAEHMRRLRIHDCPKLVSLPVCSQGSLAHLKELILDYCVRLDLTDTECIADLPCLRYLELIGLPMLVNLPAGLRSATTLENFMIADCPSFKSTAKVLQHLKSLSKLCIYNCPKLSTLRECAPALHTLDIRHCPSLIESCSTNKGEDWKIICHIPEIILDGVCSMSQRPDLSEDSRAQFGAESLSYFSLKAQTESTTKCGITELYRNFEEMKLHCLIFPNDYEFERDTLIQIWMAAGFFESSEEEIGFGCFFILLSEEYILHSRMDILTGKSLYRVNVANIHFSGMIKDKDRHYAMLFDNSTEADLSNAWHVSVVSNRIDGATFQLLETISGLKTLIFVFDDYGCSLKQVPYSLFTALPSMQVLDLSRSYIIELPNSIGNVRCLRYLDLSFTQIEKLPESIDFLTDLQTLKLKGCKQLYSLPKGLKKLVNLLHLEFDEHSRLTCMPEGIGALTQLRTLSAFIVGGTEKDCGINELQSLQNLDGSLCISGLERVSTVSHQKVIYDSNITHLQLQWNDFTCTTNDQEVADAILRQLKPPNGIKELQIVSLPGSSLPWWLDSYSIQHIVRITLLKCENLDIKRWFGMIPKLEYLSIIQMNRVKEIGKRFHAYAGVAFPKLEELVIDGMLSLESWTEVESNDFPLLKKFIVTHCPKLASLPFLSSIPSLQYLEISSCKKLKPFTGTLPASLETLIINDCPLLKSVCSKEGEDWNKIMHVTHIWIDQINIHSSLHDTDDEYENSIAEEASFHVCHTPLKHGEDFCKKSLKISDSELDSFKNDSLLKH